MVAQESKEKTKEKTSEFHHWVLPVSHQPTNHTRTTFFFWFHGSCGANVCQTRAFCIKRNAFPHEQKITRTGGEGGTKLRLIGGYVSIYTEALRGRTLRAPVQKKNPSPGQIVRNRSIMSANSLRISIQIRAPELHRNVTWSAYLNIQTRPPFCVKFFHPDTHPTHFCRGPDPLFERLGNTVGQIFV